MAEIKKINSLDEFDEFVKESKNGKTSILKIGSSWCGPCRTLEQTIRELKTDDVNGVLFGEIDADDEWAEDKIDELKIRGIPVMIAFKGGEEKERVQGGMTKVALVEFIVRNW
jgi:thioredoxin 1